MPNTNFANDIAQTKVREAYLQHRLSLLNVTADKSDMSNEYEGVDFFTEFGSIDLKWTNTVRQTYAVELLYLNGYQQQRIGWFLDSQHQTDWCLFVEFDKQTQILNSFAFRLSDLRDKVGTLTTGKYLKETAMAMQVNGWTRLIVPNSAMTMVLSSHLAEKPVNLVISKLIYQTLPSYIDCSSWFGNYADYVAFLPTQVQN